MIQRIQTIYLTLAAIACIVCLCLPVGQFVTASGETVGTLYNLWVHIPTPLEANITTDGSELVLAQEAAGTHSFAPWGQFALLVIVASALVLDIFLYRQRLVQSRLAMLCFILLFGWYGIHATFALILPARYEAVFQLTPWAALPAIAAILSYMAFRAILKDEMLVRSLDRLR